MDKYRRKAGSMPPVPQCITKAVPHGIAKAALTTKAAKPSQDMATIAEWTAQDGYPFLQGTRHSHVFRLARRAKHEGYSLSEVLEYCRAHCISDDFTEAEAESHCKAAWQDRYQANGAGKHKGYWDKEQKEPGVKA